MLRLGSKLGNETSRKTMTFHNNSGDGSVVHIIQFVTSFQVYSICIVCCIRSDEISSATPKIVFVIVLWTILEVSVENKKQIGLASCSNSNDISRLLKKLNSEIAFSSDSSDAGLKCFRTRKLIFKNTTQIYFTLNRLIVKLYKSSAKRGHRL